MAKPIVIALTGGPSSGKTALAYSLKREFDPWIEIAVEAATVLFSGGFPRATNSYTQKCQQRAIYHVQKEIETLAKTRKNAKLLICDRGSLDGLAYWPGNPKEFLKQINSTVAKEVARYDYVLHLRTPDESNYDVYNPYRKESHAEAVLLDRKVLKAWSVHPRRYIIGDEMHFNEKISKCVSLVRSIFEGKPQKI